MRTFAAKSAKDHFGNVLDTAQHEPVVIKRHGRSVAVVLSMPDFERFQPLEDRYLGDRAVAADRQGYLGSEESERLVSDLLHAED